ncbi:Arginase/deacetylase [Polyplosphaeria fusca]|uniref:Arginase/deacetylase n=1 Tax=Polyplosphaeria fusca TaxID=682080 RepID=A0A9P4QKA3_9PLEO|nr:Arginase/deacetylase [Polyplosphaeria fusca]
MQLTQLLPHLLILQSSSRAFARKITFPSVSGYQSQERLFGQGGIDVTTGSMFAGLTTYANLPYVHCLAGEGEEVEKYDIAILGAPFDTGVTARPGARYGPGGIRQGSRRIVPDEWDIETGENVFLDWAKVVDCGDAPLTFLDNTVALEQLDESHKITSGRSGNSSEYPFPRIVTLGGDHTTTLSALRSTHQKWGKVSVIHFDSHLDTWDPEVLGGGISHYAGINHGTFLHIAHEEGLIRNTSIHAGIRAPMVRPKGDLRNDLRCGFQIVMARDIDRIGVSGIIQRLKSRVGDSLVYISVDIDVLDPAYAPATGTAEVGGWTTRELLSVLDGLRGLKVVGADVVEVAPIYDNPGETTVLAAAEIVRSLVGLMVNEPVKI